MGDKIFLSYRREDASADARSIYQRLRTTFGKDQLFIDVDTIERGRDFRDALEANLGQCRVLLAVIGPKWLSIQDDSGQRRIDNENDFVRLEIAKALAKNITVIPVLVSNAPLPKADQLPDDIRGLVYRQAAIVRHESFPQDMDTLERDIQKSVKITRRRLWMALAGTLVVLGIAISSSIWLPFAEALPGIGFIFANFARDRDIASVMARCVMDAPHPEKEAIAEDIASRLTRGEYEYGWKTAPNEKSESATITWRRMSQISAAGGELKIHYDWRNGRLRLVPVVKEEYSTRGMEPEGTRSLSSAPSMQAESVLQGAWSQNNGYGCVELIFDDSGAARARWGVATSNSYDAEAFVRKRP